MDEARPCPLSSPSLGKFSLDPSQATVNDTIHAIWSEDMWHAPKVQPHAADLEGELAKPTTSDGCVLHQFCEMTVECGALSF
jgi:hypothetical protein